MSSTDTTAQTTHRVLMIRPCRFFANPETAKTNAFQSEAGLHVTEADAVREFDAFADTLRAEGVDVIVVDDTPEPATPDAVFPNNWLSTHADGTVVTYPMQPVNRRAERRTDIIDALRDQYGLSVARHVDLSALEQEGTFLEGTGSMVLDRVSRRAYACWSARTHEAALHNFCHTMEYEPIGFDAFGEDGTPIYHTNVMMCVGSAFIVACVEAIGEKDRERVAARMAEHHQLVPISMAQMNQFAGNMLEVKGRDGDSRLVMSRRAFDALTSQQRSSLEQHTRIVPVAINAIEDAAGGSVRCMLAEIFLPSRASLEGAR